MTTTGRYIIQNEDQSSRDDLSGASLPLPNPPPNSPLHLSPNSSIHPSDSPIHPPSKPSPTDIMSSPNWPSLSPSQSFHHPTLTEDLSTQHRLSAHGDITNDIIDDIISRKDDITYDITLSRDDITHDITFHDGDITLHEDDITSRQDDITDDITSVFDDIMDDITFSKDDITLVDGDITFRLRLVPVSNGSRRRPYSGYVPKVLYHGTSNWDLGHC